MEIEPVEGASVRDGEQQFNRVFGALRRQAVRVAQRLVGAWDAEDVVQAAYIRLWRRAIDPARDPLPFDDLEHLKALVFRCIRTEAWNIRRAEQRLAAATTAFEAELVMEGKDRELPEWGPEPLGASDHPLWLEIEAGLAAMPERCRFVYLLRQAHGLSYESIATGMGISVATVRVQVVRGNRIMQRAVAGRGSAPSDGGEDVLGGAA